MISYVPEKSAEENEEAMTEGIQMVKTTNKVRSSCSRRTSSKIGETEERAGKRRAREGSSEEWRTRRKREKA